MSSRYNKTSLPRSFQKGLDAFFNAISSEKYKITLSDRWTEDPTYAGVWEGTIIYVNNCKAGHIVVEIGNTEVSIYAYDIRHINYYHEKFYYCQGVPKFRALGCAVRARLMNIQNSILVENIMEM